MTRCSKISILKMTSLLLWQRAPNMSFLMDTKSYEHNKLLTAARINRNALFSKDALINSNSSCGLLDILPKKSSENIIFLCQIRFLRHDDLQGYTFLHQKWPILHIFQLIIHKLFPRHGWKPVIYLSHGDPSKYNWKHFPVEVDIL